MTRRALLRASDADRDQIAERLRQAAQEGRLLPEELEDRIGSALSARTYGELDALVADLPAPPAVQRRSSSRPARRVPAAAIAIALVFALMFLSAVGSAIGGHPHPGHRGMPAVSALVWLMFVVIALRFVFARHGRGR